MARPAFSVPIDQMLRLEVETPPPTGTLVNLLENYVDDKRYDGSDLGAYQWVAPYESNWLVHERRTTETAGLWALVLQNNNTTTPGCLAQTELLRVTPGLRLGVSWLLPWIATGAQYRVRIAFYDATGTTVVTQTTLTSYTTGASSTARRSYVANFTNPSNATHARVLFEARTSANAAWTATGRVFALRQVTIAQAATAAEVTDLPLITASGAWVNILGSTHTIEATREALDVGTLAATVLDSSLDPATASTIRPGRKVRLSVLRSGVWQPLFAGGVNNPSTGYALRRDDTRRARIALTALDRVQRLAAATRPYAPQSLYYVPATVEDTGVPWVIDGSSDGRPGGANTTAINRADDASALDQITLTRDTVLGYLWVNRQGVLEGYENGLPATTVATLTETDYSDLDVGFNLDKCFNSVTVKLQKYDATAQTSTEVTYGPYVDRASIADWGVRPVTLTVAGNLSELNCRTKAQTVLSKNAQPAITVSSVTVPILNDTDLPLALLDLYDRIRITNTAAGLDVLARVTGITHRISQKASGGVLVPVWTVQLDLEPDGSIATPTLQPGSS